MTTRLGRPRTFDRDEALARAMRLFWQRGYEGVSLADLTDELGINKPSLYAAFGCKEALFREAVSLYASKEGATTERALREEPTARAAIEAMLRDNAKGYVASGRPRGCMVVLASTVGSEESDAVRAFLADIRKEARLLVERRIAKGIEDGDVSEDADPARVASFYTTVLTGLSVQARDGATLATMNGIIDDAMAAWESLAGTTRRKQARRR